MSRRARCGALALWVVAALTGGACDVASVGAADALSPDWHDTLDVADEVTPDFEAAAAATEEAPPRDADDAAADDGAGPGDQEVPVAGGDTMEVDTGPSLPVDPELPPVALPPICEGAPLVIDLSLAPSPGEGRVFERLPPEAFPRDAVVVVLSAGDVDGDGRPDLLLRSPELRLLVNCGHAGFVESPALPALELKYPLSSQLYDVDDDGRTDLLLGGPAGGVQVLRQTAPLEFEAWPALLTREDAPNVLVTTIAPVGGLIYVGTLAAAELPNAPLSLAAKHELFAADSTWLLPDDGGLEQVALAAFDADSVACWRAPNFASLAIPRRQWGLDDVFYVGNDYGSDCIGRIGGGAPLLPGAVDLGGLAGPNQTMGADYFFDGEDVVMLSSEFVLQPHMWRLGADAVEQLDDRLEFTELFGHRVTWGIALEDFDGDGARDALIAHGRLEYEVGELSASAEAFLASIAVGGVMFMEGSADDGGPRFTDVSEERLPVLDGGFHAVVVADLFGGDGLGDGCPDVLVSPMMRMPVDDSTPSQFLGDAEILLCNHPRRFTGVRLPRSRRATAAVAELVLADGTRRVEPVRTSGSLTGSRDAVARFDLDPMDVPDRILISLDDGGELEVSAPLVGRYSLIEVP